MLGRFCAWRRRPVDIVLAVAKNGSRIGRKLALGTSETSVARDVVEGTYRDTRFGFLALSNRSFSSVILSRRNMTATFLVLDGSFGVGVEFL
jgi:hypothetical protein